MSLYPDGTLYALNIPGWPEHATELVVQNDVVIRTSWLLEWLRGATTTQLHAAVQEHGWTAFAMRAATPDDCARPDPTPVLIQRDE